MGNRMVKVGLMLLAGAIAIPLTGCQPKREHHSMHRYEGPAEHRDTQAKQPERVEELETDYEMVSPGQMIVDD